MIMWCIFKRMRVNSHKQTDRRKRVQILFYNICMRVCVFIYQMSQNTNTFFTSIPPLMWITKFCGTWSPTRYLLQEIFFATTQHNYTFLFEFMSWRAHSPITHPWLIVMLLPQQMIICFLFFFCIECALEKALYTKNETKMLKITLK